MHRATSLCQMTPLVVFLNKAYNSHFTERDTEAQGGKRTGQNSQRGEIVTQVI